MFVTITKQQTGIKPLGGELQEVFRYTNGVKCALIL
jgi:hypothetical protein